MTINNNPELNEFGNWNEYNLNLLTSNNWRASLVPAAAVIPAPKAYIKVVAVKKLVVGFLGSGHGRAARRALFFGPFCSKACGSLHWVPYGIRDLYFEKIRVFKAGLRLNITAWNNETGLWFYFVGF